MAEQTSQGEQPKTEKPIIIWPDREKGEDPEAYWVRTLSINLSKAKADFVAIAMVFGSIMGQKEKREGRDGLTGLKTTPLFLKDLEEAVDHVYRQREAGKPEQLCLVLIDIDDLKNLNSTYGHRKTDFIIQGIAALTSLNRRKSDVVARTGGDEFAILLPDCGVRDAVKIADCIRENIARQSKTSVSIGVAELGRHGSPEELLEKAQVARELAKGKHVGEYLMPGKGKNRVVTWWEGMPNQIEQNNG